MQAKKDAKGEKKHGKHTSNEEEWCYFNRQTIYTKDTAHIRRRRTVVLTVKPYTYHPYLSPSTPDGKE